MFAAFMRYASFLFILVLIAIYGCTSKGLLISESLINAELDFPIDFKKTRATGIWRTAEAGHGLEIYVWADRKAEDYQRNFDLEIRDAARICQVISTNEHVLEWDYMDIYFFNKYKIISNNSREVIGVIEIIMRRENLIMLRERKAPPSDYPQYWRVVSGYKDQPDSEKLLSW